MSRIDMMAPRTTTPATIRTPLSSLSELSGWISPGEVWVLVTAQGYWLTTTTTQRISGWAASPSASLAGAVQVLDPRQARTPFVLQPARHVLDLAHHAQGV